MDRIIDRYWLDDNNDLLVQTLEESYRFKTFADYCKKRFSRDKYPDLWYEVDVDFSPEEARKEWVFNLEFFFRMYTNEDFIIKFMNYELERTK